jgi:hypothetical protein
VGQGYTYRVATAVEDVVRAEDDRADEEEADDDSEDDWDEVGMSQYGGVTPRHSPRRSPRLGAGAGGGGGGGGAGSPSSHLPLRPLLRRAALARSTFPSAAVEQADHRRGAEAAASQCTTAKDAKAAERAAEKAEMKGARAKAKAKAKALPESRLDVEVLD